MTGRSLMVKNGKSTSFWLDSWLAGKPLCISHPVLFDMCLDKYISVYHVLTQQGQIQFRRWLPPLLFEQWINLLNKVYHHPFMNSKDIPIWKWNKSKMFSTKSVYEHLTKESSRNQFKHIRKARIPYKIKNFLWLVENNAILTKDNLLRRRWVDDPTCYLCLENETIQHLFFQCPVARIIWGIMGSCIGTNTIPCNIHQYKSWIANCLPGGEIIYTTGCAAVCWAI